MDASLARLVDQVQTARAAKGRLRITGAGTKDFYGNAPSGEPLDVKPLAGISHYEPSELADYLLEERANGGGNQEEEEEGGGEEEARRGSRWRLGEIGAANGAGSEEEQLIDGHLLAAWPSRKWRRTLGLAY